MSRRTKVWLGLTAMCLLSTQGWADPSTRDWLPAPAGTDIIAVYAGAEKAKRIYDDGTRLQGTPDINVQYGIYRQMHYREVAGKTVQYEVIVPMSRATMKGNGFPKEKLSGIGDVNLGAAVWLYNNEATRTYFAWEPFVILPTGRYRASMADVSAGANRWGTIQDFAFVQGFGESSYFEGMVEFEFFGKNKNYYGTTLKKKPVTRLMAFVSTDLSEATYVGLRYRYEMGGKEKINGATAMGSLSNHQLAVDLTHQINNHNQIQFRYARDMKVKNGPKFDGIQLRYAYIF